jgi:hypothetical protein
MRRVYLDRTFWKVYPTYPIHEAGENIIFFIMPGNISQSMVAIKKFSLNKRVNLLLQSDFSRFGHLLFSVDFFLACCTLQHGHVLEGAGCGGRTYCRARSSLRLKKSNHNVQTTVFHSDRSSPQGWLVRRTQTSSTLSQPGVSHYTKHC